MMSIYQNSVATVPNTYIDAESQQPISPITIHPSPFEALLILFLQIFLIILQLMKKQGKNIYKFFSLFVTVKWSPRSITESSLLKWDLHATPGSGEQLNLPQGGICQGEGKGSPPEFLCWCLT